MIKAVIFDMDGTLVDSEPIHKITRDAILVEQGIYSDELSDRGISVAKRIYWQTVCDEYGIPSSGDEFAAIEFGKILDIIKSDGVPCSKGIEQLLSALSDRGIKMAVASSSDRIYVEAVIERLDWVKYFPAVVCGDDVENAKPDPEIYLLALNKLGVSADEALAVEDSRTGSSAAYAAGLRCIGFEGENAVKSDFSYCSDVVKDMTEILNII